jgi:hypothetical protein
LWQYFHNTTMCTSQSMPKNLWKLKGNTNNYFKIWLWKLVSHCSKKFNLSICEQGTEKTFSTKAEKVTESGWVLFFIIFCIYYRDEQIHVNKLDRWTRIHYEGRNTYKILIQKPTHAKSFPTKFAYLCACAVDMAYITPPEQHGSPREFRRRMHTTLHIMTSAGNPARDVRIMTLHSDNSWHKVWRNLHAVWISDDMKDVWFIVIHDIQHMTD